MIHFQHKISLGLCLATASLPSFSSEVSTLIEMLHKNGTVNDAQFKTLKSELEEKKNTPENTSKIDYDISLNSGLKVSTKDKKFYTKIGGRVQLDAAGYFNDDNLSLQNGAELRRARIYLKGALYTDWQYKFQYDFVDPGKSGIKDFYLAYTGLDNITIKAGHVKTPFSVEALSSSNPLLFTERSLANALAPGRRLGVNIFSNHKNWTSEFSISGDSVDDKNEGWGLAGRATFAPQTETGKFWNLGVSIDYRQPHANDIIEFKSSSESHVSKANLISTGQMTDVDDYVVIGIESSAVFGSFSTQAEYIHTAVTRITSSNPGFDGWNIQAGYFLTGESRVYKNSVLKNIIPNNNLSSHGIGAWELGLRYSGLDLNSAGINGGMQQDFSFAINWYLNPVVRLSANYVKVLKIQGGENDGENPDIIQGRLQLAF